MEAPAVAGNGDIIISGPLPVLDALAPGDIRVVIDLANTAIGTYQLVPRVELNGVDLRVELFLPGRSRSPRCRHPTPRAPSRKAYNSS